MDNQENNKINNTQTNVPTGADQGANRPMETPAPSASPTSSPPAKKTSKLKLLIVGAVLVIVIILLAMIFSGMLNKSANPVPTPQAQQIITPMPSEEGVSQTPITNQQDVANTLGELDKANPDTVGADLSQNDQDASTFSQ